MADGYHDHRRPSREPLGPATRLGRPGPFGPARILLPVGQVVQTIRETEPVASALERLADTGFDQFPVVDARNVVVGAFTWKSFGRRIGEIHSADIDLAKLPVIHTDLDKPHFIAPDTFIDTGTDWKETDYAFVGSPEKLLGVLTLTDIYGRLNDFAEAFVLIYEIEHEIRDLFRDVYSPPELAALMQELSDSSDEPEAQAAAALQEVLGGESPLVTQAIAVRKITYAIGQMNRVIRQKANSRAVKELEDFSFAQYGHVIFDADHWPRFDPVFNQPKDIVQIDFGRINELRNTIFHFRRGIGPKDTDRLRRFRDKIRYDRDLHRGQAEQPADIVPLPRLHPR